MHVFVVCVRVHVCVCAYMCARMQLYAYTCVHIYTCTMSCVFVGVHVSLGVFLSVINAVFVSASGSPGMG